MITYDFSHKVVVVTGSARGIGRCIAERFYKAGAKVALCSISKTGKEELMQEIAGDDRSRIMALPCDVSRPEDIANFLQAVVGKFGTIDVLVNNAGISLHESSFDSVSPEGFDNQFATNLRGPYFLSQAIIKYWEQNQIKNANILFITSERGFYCDVIPYGLTKAAINSLTVGLARKYVIKGIRVKAIAPGVTASDMTGFDKGGNLYRENSCGKRVFLPEEVAEAATFLLSDASICISGEILPCNQGNHYRCDW